MCFNIKFLQFTALNCDTVLHPDQGLYTVVLPSFNIANLVRDTGLEPVRLRGGFSYHYSFRYPFGLMVWTLSLP